MQVRRFRSANLPRLPQVDLIWEKCSTGRSNKTNGDCLSILGGQQQTLSITNPSLSPPRRKLNLSVLHKQGQQVNLSALAFAHLFSYSCACSPVNHAPGQLGKDNTVRRGGGDVHRGRDISPPLPITRSLSRSPPSLSVGKQTAPPQP